MGLTAGHYLMTSEWPPEIGEPVKASVWNSVWNSVSASVWDLND